MESKTKKALLFLMISEILVIISTILMYSLFFSVDFEDMALKNAATMVFTTLPGAGIAIIGAIIGLIGAIYFLLGRKEFGEKHQKYVFYAIIIFVISIIVSMVIAGFSAIVTFSSLAQNFDGSSDPNQVIDSLRNSNFMSIIAALGPVSAFFGGLIWIFALFNLENKTGRLILYAALICAVITSIAVGFATISSFNNFLNSESFENMINSGSGGYSNYSQILSNYQWIGDSAIYSVIGNVITNLLYFYALYIPYQRIKTGDLVPIVVIQKQASQPDRVCPNCEKSIPFDANICPYCSKKFDDYL